MSDRIVAKRFALKFSPRPTIALEYRRPAPDPGLSTIKVRIAKLSPATHDVQGVVDALQKKYPLHLGSDVVNILQLKRLVAILLVRGREHLPQAFLDVAEPSLDKHPEPPAQKASLRKPPSLSEVLGDDAGTPGCLSSGPTPAPTPEMKRATSAHSNKGAAVSDSGSPGPEGGVRVDGGAASAEGKRDVDDRPIATLSAALEEAHLSAAPKELLLQRNSDVDVERRKKEGDDDVSRELKEGTLKFKSPPTVGIVHSVDPQKVTTMDEKLAVFVKREEKEAVTKDEDYEFDDGGGGGGGDKDRIDGGVTIDRAPTKSACAVDIDAAVDEVNAKGRPESRQKNNDDEGEKEQDTKREDEEDKEGEMEGLDEVTEMLEMVDDDESKEGGGGSGTEEASGEHGVDAEADEIVSKSVRGEERTTKPYVSNTDAAAAAEGANIATTAGGIGNDSGTDTRRQGTETPEETVGRETESDDSAGKSPLNMMGRSTPPCGIRGIGPTDDDIITENEVPVPEDKVTVATPSASSPPPPPPPAPAAAVLGPPHSLSPPPLSEMGASSASSLAGLPLPPVSGGRPRLGLLGSLPPVGGRGLPSLALRSGAGLGEAKTVADSSDATAVSGADKSDHRSSAPTPSPPPPGVLGSSARTEESLLPSSDAPLSRAAPRAYTGSTGSTRLSPLLDDSMLTPSRDGGAAGGNLRLVGSDPQGDDEKDVEGSTSKAAAAPPPRSPRQHQGQEEENAGVASTPGTRGLDRVTAAAVAGEKKAQGEGRAGGGYFGDPDGEVSDEDIPEEVSSDDDISFEQDSSNGGSGGGGGAGAGGDDDYFS